MWYGARMWLHWFFEGKAELAVDTAAAGFAEYPTLVCWQAAEALALSVAGRNGELADVITRLPSVLPDVPVDTFWLLTHSWFAAALGFEVVEPIAAAAIYERLLPYRSLHAAYGIGYFGPIECHLAILARVLGDVDGALN